MRTFLLLTAISCVLTDPAFGQQMNYVDGFDDPRDVELDWERSDNILDRPWGPGKFLVEGDAFHFLSSDIVPSGFDGINKSLFASWRLAEDIDTQNGVLRITGRANEDGNYLLHGLRLGNANLISYAFGTNVDGSFFLGSFRGEVSIVVHGTDTETQLQTGEDWLIETSAIEDRISMKFWRKGTAEPDVPQLAFLDPEPIFSGSELVIGGGRHSQFEGEPSRINLTFDEVSFRVVDEWVEGDYSINQQLDVADIDQLTRIATSGTNEAYYDLNGDQLVDFDDRSFWVKDLKHTWFGDANLDGEFNSGDLVAVFAAGEYQDNIPLNSGWATGDWNGDGDFTSVDFVEAFADGGYEQGRRQVNAVPEPSPVILFVGVLLRIILRRQPGLSS